MKSFWPSLACHLDPQMRLALEAAVANTVTNEEAFGPERGRCWYSSSENWLLESSSESLDDDGDEIWACT